MSATDAQFPPHLQVLFRPKRYKVLYGGRGAGRSWGIARALLILGTQKPLRVLCARELQNSLSESVHKVLSDQIDKLGLGAFYSVEVGKIFSPVNGTSFSFEGIKNNTTKIKSYEGIDICWLEEAIKVSRASWGVLIPTIRKPNSEIWMSFNPELETDYTFKRFVSEAELSHVEGMPEGVRENDYSYVVRMTWRDNPWFPKELLAEMERDKVRDYDSYLNVWEGHCLHVLEGAVYAKELREAQEDGRICRVPYDPAVPVSTFWDLGKRDATVVWFAQRVGMQYRLLSCYGVRGADIPEIVREIKNRPYVYGTHYLPHDAKQQRLGMKRGSIEAMVREYFPDAVSVLPRTSVADGINAARTIFNRCWFDADECAEGLRELRAYRFKVHEGQYSQEPEHNDWADAFKYFAQGMLGSDVSSRESRAQGLVSRIQGSLGFNRVRDAGSGSGAGGLGWLG